MNKRASEEMRTKIVTRYGVPLSTSDALEDVGEDLTCIGAYSSRENNPMYGGKCFVIWCQKVNEGVKDMLWMAFLHGPRHRQALLPP